MIPSHSLINTEIKLSGALKIWTMEFLKEGTARENNNNNAAQITDTIRLFF